MTTRRFTPSRLGGHRSAQRAVSVAGLAGVAVLLLTASFSHEGGWPRSQGREENEGRDAVADRRQDPDAIEAAFPQESYPPGSVARLRVLTAVHDATLRVFHVGPEPQSTVGSKEMQGVPVSRPVRPVSLRSGQVLRVPVGRWPSGLYFARLTTRDRVGFAPFVVRPSHLGEHRVAVVLPTHTWQAYNIRDGDGNGRGDSWYADRNRRTARLGRPYLNRGVPLHYRKYDVHFLHWLQGSGKQVDVLSQSDLDVLRDGKALAAAYDLIVFPGHHEYVTEHEYTAVEGFRNRGGSLLFLSANNYYWRIDIRDGVMTRIAQWRDLGRPEAALLGVQYIGNDNGEHRGAWRVRNAPAASWLFAGIRLKRGEEFSNAGIEIDAVAPSSPQGTQIVAQIPNLLGPGMTAHMTYYETKGGARVFAAGAFTLAGAIRQPSVQRLLDNLWVRMTVSAVGRERSGAR